MSILRITAIVLVCVLHTPTLFSQEAVSAPQAPPPAAPREPINPAPVDVEPAKPPQTRQQWDEERAQILMATKRYAEAVKAYDDLWKQHRDVASYLNYAGIAMIQQGNVDGARKYFERAIKTDKNFAEAISNLGAVWSAKKNYGRAVRQFTRALELRPNTASYYSFLGYAYFNQKKYPQAFEMLQKALALDPGIFERNARTGLTLADRSVKEPGLFNFTMAKAYAVMGDAARCAVYLRKAAEEGYKQLPKARNDPAFAKVLADPDVQSVFDRAAQPQNPSDDAPRS